MTDHLGKYFDPLKVFAIMDCDGKIDHLRKNDHITTMSPDHNILAFSLGFAGISQLDEEFLLSRR